MADARTLARPDGGEDAQEPLEDREAVEAGAEDHPAVGAASTPGSIAERARSVLEF